MADKIKKYKELLLGIICTLFAAFYLYETTKIQPLVETYFNARVMPYILGILMLIVGILQFLSGMKSMKEYVSSEKAEEEKNSSTVFLMIVVVFLYVLALKPIGFLISTFVVMFLQMLLLAPKEEIRVVKFLILSVVFTIVIYILFRYGLKLILPAGILG